MSVDDLVDWFNVTLSPAELAKMMSSISPQARADLLGPAVVCKLEKNLELEWQYKTWTDDDGYTWVLGRVVPEDWK